MALKQVDLQIVTESNYYNQLQQNSEIEWSFLNRVKGKKNSFKELFLKVKCREYFGGAVVCANLDIDTPKIYGFSLKDKRLSLKETLLSVSLPKADIPNFLEHLPLLRKIEKQMGIKMTRKYSTQHNDADYTKLVLIGDKKWVSSPLLISIYTQIIRSFTYKTTTTSFKSHIKELITKIAYGNDVIIFQSIESKGVDLMHLLINIDKVLGDNPLTGLNDAYLRSKKSSIIVEYSTISLPITIVGSGQWSISSNHSRHGIGSFLEALSYRRNNKSEYVSKTIGASWSKNYLELLNEEIIKD